MAPSSNKNMMKSLIFLLLTLFITLEDVQSTPLFQSKGQQHGKYHPDSLQRSLGYSSPCPLHAISTNPLSIDEINCRSSSSKELKQRRRFRRSFGYKTKCFLLKKRVCKAFKVDGITKNFCLQYDEIVCTALD